MLTKLKHFLLKVIDLTALGFLEPVVRLCYGEEPGVQIKKIGQFVVVPIIAFIVFLMVWSYLAPRHTTKYGSVPTPGEVWVAWKQILTFHQRETAKADALISEGDKRQALLTFAEARLVELEPLVEQADQALLDAREAEKQDKDARLAPIYAEEKEFKTKFAEEKKAKDNALKQQAEELSSDADRTKLRADFAAFKSWEEQQKELQNLIKDRIKLIEDEKTPAVQAALTNQTKYAEEKQFLTKLSSVAGKGSREANLENGQAKLAEYEATFETATGSEAYKLLKRMSTQESKLEKDAEKVYPKPWTLPMQIVRSILCVFAGFLVGVAIAIPIGVLCGISKTFMAAMTPFIALFKPVSPIVWLLILWIIVGGFFPDPNNSPTLDSLNWLVNGIIGLIPFVGKIMADADINPAFIASALTVAMCSLWATLVNTALGVASVDKDHINVARVLRLGFWSRLFKIILPSALPLVFAGMRISLGVGWMVLIAAELLASSEGLGKFTNDMFQNGDAQSFANICVMVFVVGIIGLFLDRIMIIFQRAVSFEGSVAAV